MAITRTVPDQSTVVRTTAWRGFVKFVNNWPEATILIPAILLTVYFYLRNPAMLNPITIRSILRTMAYPGLPAMGMVLLMIAGEIDFSPYAVMSLTAVFSAWLMKNQSIPVPLAVLAALGVALFVGLVNGVLTVKLNLISLIATLGTSLIAIGASYSFTNGLPIYPLPPEVGIIGSYKPLGLSVAFLLLIGLTIALQFMLRQTRWGSMLFATGGNRAAAEMCGVNTGRVKILAFMFTSLLAGVSGLLVMSGLPNTPGDPIIGRTLQLPIIVGVMLGGVSLYGGRGSAVGTLIGVVLMQVVYSGLVIARFPAEWQNAALGILLLLAASVDVITHYRRES